ncbi:hypothetical protein FNZ56_12060 [Pseudoluteimonas lycopersici]|uniref:Uncharacterized protein n=1 Tax=Pseudoluteimonas lycopersici TaxID=1324796 RepID=A0A516V7P3_9GAMM|nr:hypothetical protein [Lysobacter lycopersici]QDQ74562.1 hypothetical protein FNZ56_12060 [Lysobacter lycopersici]
MHPKKEIQYVVASDVNPRDGIGLETYINGDLVMEIFRDDTERRTYMTLFSRQLDFDVLESSIAQFKDRIDLNYIEYPDGPEQA